MMNILRKIRKPANHEVAEYRKAYEFENLKPQDYHWRYSRFIASYVNAGGDVWDHHFKDWLTSLGLSNDEVVDIVEMATCGACELEANARSFLGTDDPFHGIA